MMDENSLEFSDVNDVLDLTIVFRTITSDTLRFYCQEDSF